MSLNNTTNRIRRGQLFISLHCFIWFVACLLLTCSSVSGSEKVLNTKVAGIANKLQSLKRIAAEARDGSSALEESDSLPAEAKGYGGGGGHGGGYGHGGGGYGHGAITLDPVSIISLLALGAFLINNILQLLQQNTASGRSLDVSDLNLPLELSDIDSRDGGQLYQRSYDNQDEDDSPSFAHFFANLGSLYYLHPNRRNICIKKVVCNYVNGKESRSQTTQTTLKTRIFDFMLAAITKFVAPEINERSGLGSCQKFNKYCSDSILQDAKITTENKVYSTMTSLISNYAIQSLLSG